MDQDAVVAYLSDGRLLRSDNVRELAGAADQVRIVRTSGPFATDSDVSKVYICFQ